MFNNLKLYVFFIALFTGVKTQAINFSFTDTIKNVSGEITEMKVLYNNGKTREIIRLKNSKLHGVQKSFNNKGILLSETEYNDGLLCGISKKYNNEGQLKEKKTYNCNLSKNSSWLDGAYAEYSNNKLISKGNYANNLKEGKWLTYFGNGKPNKIATYKNGLIVGKYREYQSSGKIAVKANYIEINTNGKFESVKHGEYQTFFNNGDVTSEGNYDRGKKTGMWIDYNTNGSLNKETFYKNDKIHGIKNTYTYAGKLELESQYYEEIEIEGKKLTNVYHGAKIIYGDNGMVKSKSFYNYGKKEGNWQTYYNNGKLSEDASYKNNLTVGKKITYDESGLKVLENSYEIIKKDTIEISVKSGPEMRWQKGILVFETAYIKGKEQGARKSYYASGNLLSIQNFEDDMLKGESIEYYENGNIKSIRNYYPNISADNSKKNTDVGYAKFMDEEDKLTSKIYYDSIGNIAARYIYNDNKLSQLIIENILELNYFPNGKLQSEKIVPKSGQPSFARYYYLNGNTRKISFQNAENLKVNTLHFKNDGKLYYTSGSYYNKADTLLASTSTVSTITAAAGYKIKPNNFYTDTIKNGNYVLLYNNGKVYARMGFKDDLPEGDFVFYHPETNDTMIYAHFKNGYLNGSYVEKFGGKNVWKRGSYCNQVRCGKWIENENSGKIYAIKKYNHKTGNSYASDEYYSNGKLKSSNNYQTESYESRDENGNIISKSYFIDTVRKLSVSENYFANTGKLKSKSFYLNKAQDSIAELYYESGKLQSKMPYSFGKRNGTYYEYFENGNLKRKSNYENDKLEGMAILVSDIGVDTMYYRNNNLKVKPNAIACSCIDTTHSAARVGFAPSLNQLLDYNNLLSYIPNYLTPVDSLNYKSIFYTGFQNSNGYNSGFSAMNLMLFKEFAFKLPADEQIKLIFNPCITKGYISRMNVSASYGAGTRDNYSADFSPKRIALEFLKGPVKSDDINHKHFKAFFNAEGVEFTSKKELKIKSKENAESCFVPALLNNLLHIEVIKGEHYIFKTVYNYSLSRYEIKLSDAELNLFFGIMAKEAVVKLNINTPNGEQILKGNSDFMLLGGNFACGVVKINCVKNNDQTYTATANKINFTEAQIRKTLQEKGFSRINIKYAELSTELTFTFFTE